MSRRIFMTALAFLLALPFSVSAEEPSASVDTEKMITIATVNIYDAKIDTRDGNNFAISFDISNREGVQPDIRYGIELRTAGGGIAHSYVFPETVSLGRNETIKKTVNYAAPGMFSGKYELWVVSRNTSGLLLAFSKLGDDIDLSGMEESLRIDSGKCWVSIPGVDDHYALNAGADFSGSDTATFSCEIENAFKTEVEFFPSFTTYRRTVFGEKLGEHIGDRWEKLAPGEKKRFEFVIPKQSVPQSYETVFSLVSKSGERLSGEILFRYVVRGGSATIQNVTLDKSSYRAGEESVVSVFWSPSADNFPGARFEASTLPEKKVVFTLSLSSDGEQCASEMKKEFSEASEAEKLVLAFPITVTSDCPNPRAIVTIADISGSQLDAKEYSFEGSDIAEPVATDDKKMLSLPMMIGILLSSVAVLAVLATIVRRRRGAMVILFPIVAAATFFGIAPAVHADTFATAHATVTASLDNAVYSSGARVTVLARATTFFCSNAGDGLKVTTSHNGGGASTIIDTMVVPYAVTCPSSQGFLYMGEAPVGYGYTTGALCLSSVACGEDCNQFVNASCSNVDCGRQVNSVTYVNGNIEIVTTVVHTPPTMQYAGTRCGDERCWESWTDRQFYSAASAYPGNQGKVTVSASQLGENSGTKSGDLWYTVSVPAPTVTLQPFSPSTITAGQSSTISFSSTNATACSGSGIWNGNLGITSATNAVVPSSVTNTPGTYTQSVTCTGPGGSATSVTRILTVTAPSYTCTGTLPANATTYAGDDTGLASNTARSYSASNTAPKCQYTCNGGYTWNGSSCAAVAVPAATINTFTATPASIIAGNSSNLAWTTSNAQSCWISGGGIDSWTTVPNGNRNVSPASTTTYSLQCWNTAGVSSGVQNRTVTVTAASTLKVCLNSCNGGSNNFNGQIVDLAPSETRRYAICYNSASGCNSASGDITADVSTTFSATNAPSDAVTPTATKGEFQANAVPVTRSESVSIGTANGAASVTLRVTPVCTSSCAAQAGNHCQGETFNTTNSCGTPETCTNAGTRYCDFNWKEVTPGQ